MSAAAIIHLVLHILVPVGLARWLWPKRWIVAAAVMLATMAVDLDHLLADPIFDPQRCSLGYHPLHRWPALLLYCAMCCWPRSRWLGVGLVVHMLLDGSDCARQHWL